MPEKTKLTTINFQLDESFKQKIEAYCLTNHQSISDFIRSLIREKLKLEHYFDK